MGRPRDWRRPEDDRKVQKARDARFEAGADGGRHQATRRTPPRPVERRGVPEPQAPQPFTLLSEERELIEDWRTLRRRERDAFQRMTRAAVNGRALVRLGSPHPSEFRLSTEEHRLVEAWRAVPPDAQVRLRSALMRMVLRRDIGR